MSELCSVSSGGAAAGEEPRSLAPVSAASPRSLRVARPAPVRVQESGSGWSFAWKVFRRWWLVTTPLGLLLATAGAAGAWYLFEPKYEAAAWFRIEERTPFLAFDTKADESRSKAFFQTQIELIRSPLVLGGAVQRPEVAQVPEIARQSDSIAWLAKQIKVSAVGESELFRIVFAAGNSKEGATVVNAITESYFRLRDQTDSERTKHVIDLLEKEKTNRSQEVQRLRQDVCELAKQVTGRETLSTRVEPEPPARTALTDLQGRLVAAQVEGAVIAARLQAYERDAEDAAAPPASDPPEAAAFSPAEAAMHQALVDQGVVQRREFQRASESIAAKQARLQDLETRMKDGKQDPAYRQLAAELAKDREALDRLRHELRPEIETQARAILLAKRSEAVSALAAKQAEEFSHLRADLQARKVMEEHLRTEYESELKRAKQFSGDSLGLEFKRDELVRAEKVFELIAARSLQLQTERLAPARVSLLQLAEPPQAPIAWFPWRDVLLAAFTGMALPLGLALAWEGWIRRVSDSSDLQSTPELALVGEIAQLPRRTSRAGKTLPRHLNLELRVFEESVDNLQTTLTLSAELRDMRVLAVTSAVSNEGKTSVAAQLAMSLARVTKDQVLLIDGDMRSPDIHRIFDVPLEPGLAAVLAKQATVSEAIISSWSDRVHFLPAGRLAANPLTLLAEGAWKSLLAEIPQQYRYIVVDTPPVLAASESLVLAQAADAVLICAMCDVSRRDQVRMVRDRVAAVGGRPVGVVLSGVPVRSYLHRYGNYNYLHDR